MRMLIQRLLLLLPWRRRAAERDMRDELRAIAAMADPRELGNLTVAAEDVRAQWGWIRLEQTAQDVRYAIRTLRKAPGFTLAAVASLAIGIGANTALFTLTDSVMWKLLPIDDPEHLLTVDQQTPDSTRSSGTTVARSISPRTDTRGWRSASQGATSPRSRPTWSRANTSRSSVSVRPPAVCSTTRTIAS
jgi:hypothetical protein